MTHTFRKTLAVGTALAIAVTASTTVQAVPLGAMGTQIKQAVPKETTDARFRRGAAVAAGVGLGFLGAAAALSANQYYYGGYYDSGYAYPGYYYGEPEYAEPGYGPTYYYPAPSYCRGSGYPERQAC